MTKRGVRTGLENAEKKQQKKLFGTDNYRVFRERDPRSCKETFVSSSQSKLSCNGYAAMIRIRSPNFNLRTNLCNSQRKINKRKYVFLTAVAEEIDFNWPFIFCGDTSCVCFKFFTQLRDSFNKELLT